jgi:AraC-like DNA-binding protein
MGTAAWKSESLQVSTILTADEQLRVDAAGEGIYQTRHRRYPQEVLSDIRRNMSSVVLLSVCWCEEKPLREVSHLIRELPRVPTVAIVSSESERTVSTILRLGRDGVRYVVDVRSPTGWGRLRGILADQIGDRWERIIREAINRQCPRVTTEAGVFFEALVKNSRTVSSVRQLAEEMNILPSTLMSRFYRAGLPTPKQYLSWIRLVRAAYLFENSGFSIANVANHLDYSSPQSFGRHVRGAMGMTAVDFRQRFNGTRMLNLFERQLLTPYRAIYMWFRPFSGVGTRLRWVK